MISSSTSSPLLRQLSPFLLGLTLLFWAGARWWIPLLTLLEVWRHVLSRVRLEYRTAYWSLVFPVGMYAACTFEVAAVVQLGPVLVLAQWVTYLALGVWLIVLVGLVHDVVGHATRQPRPAAVPSTGLTFHVVR